MEVAVQNHLVAPHSISQLALNRPNRILAAILDSADSLAFYLLDPSPLLGPARLLPLFANTSKPAGSKSSLAWSHDGLHLALGSNNFQLWRLHNQRIVPVKTYPEEFIDIRLLSWSPDSLSVAYGGLSRRNVVKIRNIETGGSQEIAVALAVCGLSFDPFGKYLLVLLRDNILQVYNSSSLALQHQVPLSPGASTGLNVSTVKDIRQLGWSPDFAHVLCPSLDDSCVSLSLSLSRSNQFGVRQAFFGHVSSISGGQFSPNLYRFEGEVSSILALGDSHGVVSLWRVGSTKVYDQPVLVVNSEGGYHEVVEGLEWTQQGDALIVNVMKRYINILRFGQNAFGEVIPQPEKMSIIEENYGATSLGQISNQRLEVFSVSSNRGQEGGSFAQKGGDSVREVKGMSNAAILPAPYPPEKPLVVLPAALGAKVEYVRVNEQITVKDRNNRKKIQPAMLVRKDDMASSPVASATLAASVTGVLYSTVNCFQALQLPLLRPQPATTTYRLAPSTYLQLRRLQQCTVLRLSSGSEQQPFERVFAGGVEWLCPLTRNGSPARICLLNGGNLYCLGLQLELLELPHSLGEVHRISVNAAGDVYYLSPKGLIRGFNLSQRNCLTLVPVPLQRLLEAVGWQPSKLPEEEQRVVEEFSAEEQDHNLYLTLAHCRDRYFYCRGTQSWVSLQLNAGLLLPGHSLRVAQDEEALTQQFFCKLTRQFLPQAAPPASTSASSSRALQHYEANLIYYKKYHPSRELYLESLMGLLGELRARGLSDRLRTELHRYFTQEGAEGHEGETAVRSRLRQLGGPVVQEFVLFGQL